MQKDGKLPGGKSILLGGDKYRAVFEGGRGLSPIFQPASKEVPKAQGLMFLRE